MIRTAGHGARDLPYWREIRDPRARQESQNDQAEYRAALDRYFAASDTPRSLPPSPPYVPPVHPHCLQRCRNGYHEPKCREHR